MAHTSLQVCMDSSDHWLQGTMSEDLSSGLDSTSSPPGGTDCMLAAACSSRAGPPLMERRLRPPHDQNLKCPRCDSTHTKFCYYNNYSLSQPRYFCKTCRRYWTKGGTLRNIPVGGGCRKNKKSSSKKSNSDPNNNQGSGLGLSSPGSANSTDLHLSFPEVQLPPHLANLIGAQMSLGGGNFMESGLIRPIDFMESKYEALVGGGARGHDFMGNNGNDHHQFGAIGGSINMNGYNGMSNTNGFSAICSSSPFGVSNGDHMHEGNNNNAAISFMDQRLLLPYDANDHHQQPNGLDVKPSPKLLSLEWQDSPAKDTSFGYNGSFNSWSGMLGAYQASTTNSMV